MIVFLISLTNNCIDKNLSEHTKREQRKYEDTGKVKLCRTGGLKDALDSILERVIAQGKSSLRRQSVSDNQFWVLGPFNSFLIDGN